MADQVGTDQGPAERQQAERQTSRTIKLGTLAIAGIAGAIAVLSAIVAMGAEEQNTPPAAASATGTAAIGPSGSGPTVTGPAVIEPAIGSTGDPLSVGFKALPPETAAPSKPLSGELVLSDGGIHPWYTVNVYADGRLIWARDTTDTPGHCCGGISALIEQRLTPEGVELLRSGAVELGGMFENPGEQLPVSVWEEPKLEPYVPSRYAVCPWNWPMRLQPPDPQHLGLGPPVMSLVPAAAQDLLRGARELKGDCLDVTIEEARSLGAILTDAGYEGSAGGSAGFVFFEKDEYLVAFVPMLPDGRFQEGVGG